MVLSLSQHETLAEIHSERRDWVPLLCPIGSDGTNHRSTCHGNTGTDTARKNSLRKTLSHPRGAI